LCTGIVVPGVRVDVWDAKTGESIADSARGDVRDGTYADSLRLAGYPPTGAASQFRAADERAGTYTISVVRPGYAPWSKSGVRVRRQDGCHVAETHVVARLRRVKAGTPLRTTTIIGQVMDSTRFGPAFLAHVQVAGTGIEATV